MYDYFPAGRSTSEVNQFQRDITAASTNTSIPSLVRTQPELLLRYRVSKDTQKHTQ